MSDLRDFEFILASGSPRRVAIMREHGLEPQIRPADIEENLPPICGMKETVMFLSLKKAMASAALLPEYTGEKRRLVIAADTIVYFFHPDGRGEIMGKPENREDARRMLTLLRGTSHFVVTGVSLIEPDSGIKRCFAEVTRVFFKDYSDRELEKYLDTPEAYDKAGGYAIQGAFGKYTDHIEGYYDTVVGFPWNRIKEEIGRL